MNRLPTPEPGTPSGRCPVCGTARNGHVLPVQWPPTRDLVAVGQTGQSNDLSGRRSTEGKAKGTFPSAVALRPLDDAWRLPEILNWERQP